jgi:prepilin-type N-terminal cleavage/methylation domain-containing protein
MNEASSESGFSLVELLVAMTITLIVSGAIYGLMTGGQNAFRREPELAERQQNIRLAMDMMVRDLANAGTGLPPFAQVFTQGLGAVAASPLGPSGARSDDLEILTVSGRESEPVCTGTNNGALAQVSLVRGVISAVDPGTLAFLVFSSPLATPVDDPPAVYDDMWTVRRVSAVGTSTPTPPGTLTWSECATTGATTTHAVLLFGTGYAENAPASLCQNAPVKPFGNYPGTGCGGNILTRVVFGRQVKYQIRNDTDGVPVLQRISSDDLAATPQVLARGIEELQVQYSQFNAPGTWLDTAPAVATPANEAWVTAAPKFGTIVDRVRLTLTSRSEARNIFGATNRADGTDPRIRGQLSSTVSPRAALLGASRGRPSPDPGGFWE